MARYLFRLENKAEFTPADIDRVAARIREILGSKEVASHFRIGTHAFEFNLFAQNEEQLGHRKATLEKDHFRILTVKQLDTPPITIKTEEALRQGIDLFNDERFWESHEVLEQIWRESKGTARDSVQGVILAAAAFVHYQKDEPEICLSVLARARTKIGPATSLPTVDLETLRANINAILRSRHIRILKIETGRH